jgi:hypothetical protein
MKTLIATLTAAATLAAAPAFAGLEAEQAIEPNAPVQVVAAPQTTTGAGAIVTSETDGLIESADLGDVSQVAYPADSRPQFEDRGR